MAHNTSTRCHFCTKPAQARINKLDVCRSHIAKAGQHGSIYRIPHLNITPRSALELLSGGAATVGKN